MPIYHALGRMPAKRHIVFEKESGGLYYEELIGNKGFTGPSSLHDIFAKEGLVPNVVLTARDADVIKTYVRLGLGVGIVASMAVEQKDEEDLVHIDASDLFPAHTTWIGFRRGGLLRKYQLDFIQLFAPQLTRRLIERAASASTQADVEQLMAGIELPLR